MMLLKGRFFVLLAATLMTCMLFIFQSGAASAAAPVSTGTPVLGIQGDGVTSYPGISWQRLAYPTCGNSNLSGQTLQSTVKNYHRQGIHILLTICQPTLSKILDPTYLADAAQGGADAVQCGNEQMKYDPPYTIYVPPDVYAQFFHQCETAMHAVNPAIPVLMGSLDPHVVGPDNAALAHQVSYLYEMQAAMNTTVTPGGNWTWTSQRIGLIDSWHNGYPSSSDNNLYQLFVFWSQQFGVNLNTGLAQHLWVVEGTGCVRGCGLYGSYQIAVSHVITLITDVLTATQYHVSFFYFTGKDFVDGGLLSPFGVLDVNGNPKPLREDLPMGARALVMTCSSGSVTVTQQEQLLASLYAGCKLPGNYVSILES